MKTMKWLMRREFWEHRGSMLWAPLVVGAIMVFFSVTLFGLGMSADGLHGSFSVRSAQTADGLHGSFSASTAQVNVNGTPPANALASLASDELKLKLASAMSNSYMFFSTPIFVTLGFIVFFYCLSSLYDERRDRSILFWKSLPISDSMTVLSKLAMAAAVVPLIAIAVSTVTSLLMLLMACLTLATKGVNLFGMVLSTPALYLAPFKFVGLIPVYLLWAMPTIGWLMMVSAWARSKVFLWAVGVPVLSLALLVWANIMFHFDWNIAWYAKNIIARILLGVMPGAWLPFSGMDKSQLLTLMHNNVGMEVSTIFIQSWATLASPDLWIGVAAGVAMLYVAIRMRRWREDA